MKYAETPQGYMIKLEIGDEFQESLVQFAIKKKLLGASYQGIGALTDVELGFFSREENRYIVHPYQEEYELISAIGNISHVDDKHFAHTHVVLGTLDGNTVGGI